MPKGKVKFFNEKKGWGFLTSDEDGEESFCHFSEIQGEGYRNLTQGEAVVYDVVKTDKGLSAKTVKKLS